MLEFKDIEIEDKEWVDELLLKGDYPSTDYSFTTLFIWNRDNRIKIGRYKGALIIRVIWEYSNKKICRYLFPSGEMDNSLCKEIIDLYIEDAKVNGGEFVLDYLLTPHKEIMERLYGDRFSYTLKRESFDYVYLTESLVTLKGKKLQSKRNFINRFKRDNNWSYEQIDSSNISECFKMNEKWCSKVHCKNNPSKQEEMCSVVKALSNFFALNLVGGIIRVDSDVVAYSFGERVNSNTFLVHVEKAFADIVGAYPTISNEFLKSVAIGDNGEYLFKYVNREDDAGDDNLREAKMQYNPTFLLEKWTIREK